MPTRPRSTTDEHPTPRRKPKQERARQTVDAVLEAVRLVVKRHGAQALTTNRIAEIAGVSVGSLYQYFPDKHAIVAALHDRHIADVRRVLETTAADCAAASLPDFARELVDGLVNAHAHVGEAHDVVSSANPESARGFTTALHHAFERVLARPDQERYGDAAARMLFVLPRIVESLVHGASDPARSSLSREGARSEALRAVVLYVNSFEGRATRPLT